MALTTKLTIRNTEGDDVVDHVKTAIRQSYTYFAKLTRPLTASELESIDLPFTTVEYLYLELRTASREVRVYKNGEATYWTFSSHFLAAGVEISELVLYSESAADVLMYMGGDS